MSDGLYRVVCARAHPPTPPIRPGGTSPAGRKLVFARAHTQNLTPRLRMPTPLDDEAGDVLAFTSRASAERGLRDLIDLAGEFLGVPPVVAALTSNPQVNA